MKYQNHRMHKKTSFFSLSRNYLYILSAIILIGLFAACEETRIPKPRGYYRIALPELNYKKAENQQYSFDILENSKLVVNPKNQDWYNLEYPYLKGSLLLTYFKNTDIEGLSEDGRKSAFNHSIRADDIIPMPFAIPEHHIYGLVYSIEGDAATPMILMLTDSIDQFLHGTFYFNCPPNSDSLKPMIHFIRQDAQHIIETFRWKKYQNE